MSAMKNKLLVVFLIFLIASCSTVSSVISGTKKYESLTTLEQRQDYYNDFLNPTKGISQLRHYNHTDSLLLGFGKLAGTELPFLVVHDSKSDNYYDLNCFEDITADIQSLNDNNVESLKKADQNLISLTKRFMRQTVEDKRLTPSFSPDENKRYEIFYVGGLFLGNKFKKRVLPITTLNDVKSIQIVEISMSLEDYNNK